MISTTRWCRLPSLQLGAGPEQATSLSGPEQAILQCCWDPLRRAVAFVADTANVGGHDVKRKDGVLSFVFMCTSELGVTLCMYFIFTHINTKITHRLLTAVLRIEKQRRR